MPVFELLVQYGGIFEGNNVCAMRAHRLYAIPAGLPGYAHQADKLRAVYQLDAGGFFGILDGSNGLAPGRFSALRFAPFFPPCIAGSGPDTHRPGRRACTS